MILQLDALESHLGKQHKKVYLEVERERASWIILYNFYLWDSFVLSLQGQALLFHLHAKMKLARVLWHYIECKEGLEQKIKCLG